MPHHLEDNIRPENYIKLKAPFLPRPLRPPPRWKACGFQASPERISTSTEPQESQIYL